MAANEQNIIGKVSKLTGKAFAKGTNGELRELQIGDPVYEGEVVVAAAGAKVELAFNNGGAYFIRDNESVTLDGMVFGDRTVESLDAALKGQRGELDEVSRAIEEDGRLGRDA